MKIRKRNQLCPSSLAGATKKSVVQGYCSVRSDTGNLVPPVTKRLIAIAKVEYFGLKRNAPNHVTCEVSGCARNDDRDCERLSRFEEDGNTSTRPAPKSQNKQCSQELRHDLLLSQSHKLLLMLQLMPLQLPKVGYLLDPKRAV